MGKRWTDEERSSMRKHYPTARSVEEVAAMLGRPKCSVVKKALEMGLSRPDLHEESVGRITRALSDAPKSASEIAEAAGVARSTANRVLSRMSDEGLCHIVIYRKRPGRGSDIPMWVLGEGENAENDRAEQVAARKAQRAVIVPTPVKVFRDPFAEAFFGRAA